MLSFQLMHFFVTNLSKTISLFFFSIKVFFIKIPIMVYKRGGWDNE